MCLLHFVYDSAGVVNHIQGKGVFGDADDRETRSGRAEHRACRGLNLACERGRRVDNIVYRVARHPDVLEVVDMAAGIDGHIGMAAENGQKTLLHVGALGV